MSPRKALDFILRSEHCEFPAWERGWESEQLALLWGEEYVKAIYCRPAYLTYMQSTSWEMLVLDEAQARIKLAGRNINNLRYVDDSLSWQKVKKN